MRSPRTSSAKASPSRAGLAFDYERSTTTTGQADLLAVVVNLRRVTGDFEGRGWITPEATARRQPLPLPRSSVHYPTRCRGVPRRAGLLAVYGGCTGTDVIAGQRGGAGPGWAEAAGARGAYPACLWWPGRRPVAPTSRVGSTRSARAELRWPATWSTHASTPTWRCALRGSGNRGWVAAARVGLGRGLADGVRR